MSVVGEWGGGRGGEGCGRGDGCGGLVLAGTRHSRARHRQAWGEREINGGRRREGGELFPVLVAVNPSF